MSEKPPKSKPVAESAHAWNPNSKAAGNINKDKAVVASKEKFEKRQAAKIVAEQEAARAEHWNPNKRVLRGGAKTAHEKKIGIGDKTPKVAVMESSVTDEIPEFGLKANIPAPGYEGYKPKMDWSPAINTPSDEDLSVSEKGNSLNFNPFAVEEHESEESPSKENATDSMNDRIKIPSPERPSFPNDGYPSVDLDPFEDDDLLDVPLDKNPGLTGKINQSSTRAENKFNFLNVMKSVREFFGGTSERIKGFFSRSKEKNAARYEKLNSQKKTVLNKVNAYIDKHPRLPLALLGGLGILTVADLGFAGYAVYEATHDHEKPEAASTQIKPGLDALRKTTQFNVDRPVASIPSAKFELKEGQGAGMLFQSMQQSLRQVSGIENTDFGKMLLHKDPNLLAQQLGFPLTNAEGYMKPGDSLEFNGRELLFHRGNETISLLKVNSDRSAEVVTHADQMREKLGVHEAVHTAQEAQSNPALIEAPSQTTAAEAVTAPVAPPPVLPVYESPYNVRSVNVIHRTENVPPAGITAQELEPNQASASPASSEVDPANVATAKANQAAINGQPIPATAHVEAAPQAANDNDVAPKQEQKKAEPLFPKISPLTRPATVTQAPAPRVEKSAPVKQSTETVKNSFGVSIDPNIAHVYADPGGHFIAFGGNGMELQAKAFDYAQKNNVTVLYNSPFDAEGKKIDSMVAFVPNGKKSVNLDPNWNAQNPNDFVPVPTLEANAFNKIVE